MKVNRVKGPLERTKGPPDIFPELGAALFWLYALDQAMDGTKDDVVLGLAWARDCMAHGVTVTAPAKWRKATATRVRGRDAAFVVGSSRVKSLTGHAWLTSEVIAANFHMGKRRTTVKS